ncbi:MULTISPECIES: MFS transporter [Streptomyces]|uniref:MFS transporter n=1 Tax=Streptomyces TaxID=1883 RepID=UPI00163B91E4|nr:MULTISPECIES: MFS transporter [Streptomyces]MBC2879683.1 MFS transporter [Streptomyces sp. TYQ1024]UBI35069.1 MFS transporter [Streptomyces mobaraensis]UKW27663.1 MFS transporter [Streptomyces sp. TYQ1024]
MHDTGAAPIRTSRETGKPGTPGKPGTSGKAGRKEWTGLAVLILPVLLVSLDMQVLSYALPFISAELAPSGSQLLWIVDIYPFVLAGLLLTMGSLGDRIGRRRLLMLGAVVFGLASVTASLATDPVLLIGTRALLGVGGATLMPSTLSLIRTMFTDDGQRRAAIAVWTGAFAAGAVLGPLLGGILLEHFWWGSVFLVNLPVMALLLLLAPALLPESRASGPGRFDLLSAALSLAAVLPAVYGIQKTAEDGLRVVPAAAFAVGLAVGWYFLRRQRRLDEPMLDVRLFGDRAFSASVATSVLAIFSLVGSGLFTTQYLQMVLGYGPLRAGLWALPAAGAAMASSALAPLLARAVRPVAVVAGGLVVAAGGYGVLTRLDADSGVAVIVTGTVVMAAGITLVMTTTSDLVIATAPADRAGSVSGLSQTATEFGGAFGIAVLGSIGTAVYRHDMARHLPDDLPSGAATAARDTLGGAVDTAGRLPAETGADVLAAARDAFAHGLRIASWTTAGLLLAMAVLSVFLLRHTVRGGDADGGGSGGGAPGEGTGDGTAERAAGRQA